MEGPFRKIDRPTWELFWRVAGLAAAIWALIDLALRHHWFGF